MKHFSCSFSFECMRRIGNNSSLFTKPFHEMFDVFLKHEVRGLRKHCKILFSLLQLESYSTTKRTLTNFILKKKYFLKGPFICNRTLMDLSKVVKIFEDVIDPNLSESWDNTGLLIEPSKEKLVSVILFTNDLTDIVLKEATSIKADLVVSYHPPLFSAIKSLKRTNWKDRILLQCIENAIAVYSPHTACDAVKGGVNDWLIKCFELSEVRPIKQSHESSFAQTYCIECFVPQNTNLNDIINPSDFEILSASSNESKQYLRVKVNKHSLPKVLEILTTNKEVSSVSLTTCNPLPLPSCGMGRIGKLQNPLPLHDCIALLKNYLSLDHIRFAQGVSHSLDSQVSSIAVCAGSGSSILKDVDADLYITGEMSHHELLHANHRNVSVILCEHSNTERGYLKKLICDLSSKLPNVNLVMSSMDKDPVTIL